MNCVGNIPQSNSSDLLNLFGDFLNEGACLCSSDIYGRKCYSNISMSELHMYAEIRAFFYFARADRSGRTLRVKHSIILGQQKHSSGIAEFRGTAFKYPK